MESKYLQSIIMRLLLLNHLCVKLDVGTVGIQYDFLSDGTLPTNAQGEGHASSQTSRAQHFSRTFQIHYRLPTNITLQG